MSGHSVVKAQARIPWSGKAFEYTEEEIAAVVDVMRSADPLTQGPRQARFEKDFAEYHGVKHAFAVANCTNALDLIALLARLGPGDEVILPAHTFCATAIPFARTGAKLVWADVDPKTWVASVESIKRLVTPRTKAVVVVHLYGLMADMPAVAALAKEKNLLLVEDVAQAIGAELDGRKAGAFGDFAAFSFHAQKSLTTFGEGGALIVKSDEHAKLVPGLRHNGVRPFEGTRPDYWIPAMANVDSDLPGVWPYNFCLSEAQSALASKLLLRLDEMNAARVKRAVSFKGALAKHPELVFQHVPANRRHAYHLMPARYDGKAGRDALIRMLHDEYGIKAIVQYHPLYRYPLFQKAGFGEHDCPETDRLFDNMVSFPFHLWMSDEQFDYLVASVGEALARLRG